LAKQSLTAGQSFVQALIQMSALRPIEDIPACLLKAQKQTQF
jgi:hypothetical protein